ncbi:hypothetical protein [Mycobacterium sp. HNNTM2301]|uniref:hypothetical protein n=1 Tax=Mycobacterium hainanense TaxID=3289775 RepID=UPI0035A682D0
MKRRSWIPDPATIADQLVEDYRNATDGSHGDLDAISTMASWFEIGQGHGEEFTEDDWIALVQELARRLTDTERDDHQSPQ